MSTEAIIGNIAQFIIYIGIFYIVLGWLKVKENKWQRSVILAVILKLAEFVSALAFGLLLAGMPNIGIIGLIFGTGLTVIIFYLIVKKLLILQTWQYIVIPIGVSLIGNVVLAVVAMFYYKAMV